MKWPPVPVVRMRLAIAKAIESACFSLSTLNFFCTHGTSALTGGMCGRDPVSTGAAYTSAPAAGLMPIISVHMVASR